MFRRIIEWFKNIGRNKKARRMEVVASTYEAKELPEPTDICALVDVSGVETDYQCGHRHPDHFAVNLYGEKFCLTDKKLAERQLCANCHLEMLKKFAIRCAKCGFAIMPGDGVALYCFNKKLFKKTAWITLVGDDKEKDVIGCLRWDCCPSGGFFAGHWTGERFKPAFVGGSAAAEAMRTGKVVIVGDVGDLNK